jgi:uncharacterized protein
VTPSHPRAQALIQRLQMRPHPEGGWYVEVQRSPRLVQPDDGRPSRCALTGIYFLLADQGISRWHRVASDEVWCHLEGASVQLHLLDAQTLQLASHRLGPVADDRQPQATAAAGTWQAARCEGDFSLLACFVAPGFEFADFELLSPADPLAGWLAGSHPSLAQGWLAPAR